jgi:hypothetical protein
MILWTTLNFHVDNENMWHERSPLILIEITLGLDFSLIHWKKIIHGFFFFFALVVNKWYPKHLSMFGGSLIFHKTNSFRWLTFKNIHNYIILVFQKTHFTQIGQLKGGHTCQFLGRNLVGYLSQLVNQIHWFSYILLIVKFQSVIL